MHKNSTPEKSKSKNQTTPTHPGQIYMARSRKSSKPTRPAGAVKEKKLETIQAVQACLKTHPHLYLYQLVNPRNNFFQRLRRDFADHTVFWMGKNKVLQRALGKTVDDEHVLNGHVIAKKITGKTGILLSKLKPSELEDALSSLPAMFDNARPGSIANYPVIVQADPDTRLLSDKEGEPIPASQEPILRTAGMPTMLRGGSVLLAQGSEYVVCQSGDSLTPAQAKILKIFKIQLDEFSVKLGGHFDVSTGILTE